MHPRGLEAVIQPARLSTHPPRIRPTLGQVFACSLLGLAAVLALLFYIVFENSRATIIESSERTRDAASEEISERLAAFLDKAPNAVKQFQFTVGRGLAATGEPQSVEQALFAVLLSNPDIGELTLTYGKKKGFDESGAIQLEPTPRGQWSVVRASNADGSERFWSRHVRQQDGSFMAERHDLDPKARTPASPLAPEAGGAIPDPTDHPTFATPASKDFDGELLWSDLHWSQLDADLPDNQKRVEVSVQQVVSDAAGQFAGVLRVGLLADQLDHLVQLNMASSGREDPHRIFICDAEGR